MKKIAAIFAVSLVAAGVTPANASQVVEPTVVIIDSGFDATLLGDQVIKELCISAVSRACDNGQSFDDSKGASGTKYKIHPSYKKDWDHGTIMASIVSQVNPHANLILIRNARVAPSGRTASGTEADLEKSLEWVSVNTKEYNIVAVSFSRGSHSYAAQASEPKSGVSVESLESTIATLKAKKASPAVIARYEQRLAAAKAEQAASNSVLAPCPAPSSLVQDIAGLQSAGVATLIAAGNDGDRVHVDTPACIDEAVAVSTLAHYGNADGSQNVALNSNSGQDTDFVVSGDFDTVLGRVALSTSAATAALAGYWSKVSDGTFAGTYSMLTSNGLPVKDLNNAKAILVK